MSAAAQSASVLASEKHFNEKMLMNFLDAFWPMLQGYVDDDTKARAIDCATLLGEFRLYTWFLVLVFWNADSPFLSM